MNESFKRFRSGDSNYTSQTSQTIEAQKCKRKMFSLSLIFSHLIDLLTASIIRGRVLISSGEDKPFSIFSIHRAKSNELYRRQPAFEFAAQRNVPRVSCV